VKGGPYALVGEGGWHADVDDAGVHLVRGQRAQQARTVADGGDHVHTVLGEQPGQGLPEQAGILGDHDAHGTSTVTTVGPPGGLER
jgi:hypothetical protein